MRLRANAASRLSGTLVVLGAGCILCGCNDRTEQAPPAPAPTPDTKAASTDGFPRTVTDARGKQITLAASPKHIVSLMPSNTEILYAVGKGDSLVMDTTACDYPPAAKKKARFNAFGTSIEPILAQAPD